MGFTYREGNEGKLSITQMDDNFRYTEQQISSLTASIVALEEQLSGLTPSNSGSGATGPTGPQGATGPAGFGTTGAISFPFLPGNQRTGSGDNLQFEKGSVYQKIISTQDGTESAPTVERLVISGGDSYQNGPTYSGEGGDIYLWAGKGQNGGDIKVDAGDGISSGGTVKIRGGYTETGDGGFVEIWAGESSNGNGGDVQVTAGNGYGSGMTGIGGDVLITSGYGSNTAGNITLNARDGGGTAGNVIVQTDSVERMRITDDGKIGIGTTTPTVALDVVGDIKNTGLLINTSDGLYKLGDWDGNFGSEERLIVDSPNNSAYFDNYLNNIKVGINTASPSVTLDVNGDVNITGVITSTSSMILKPDSSLETDQYIILDPTEGGPNHIHIRAGGAIDDSTVDLFIGGEDNNLKVSDTTKTVQINSKNLYTQDSVSFSVGPDYGSATWSGNLITITTNGTLAFGDVANFINGYQAATDIFTVFYDPTTAVSLNITNKDISNYPTHVLTVDQTAPTASLAITGIDIEIVRYQSGRVTADNGTVTIQTGDTDSPEYWVFGTTGSITFPDNTVQTTAYVPKYKVYTAIVSQIGTSSTQPISTGDLTVGVTYFINNNISGNFTNVGAPNNDNGTYFVATGTTPTDWGTQPIGYDSILTFDTGAPTVTVLENTIGNIWWVYFNVGDYACFSDNLFTIGKTTVFIGPENYQIQDTSNLTHLTVYAEESFVDYVEFLLCDPIGRLNGLVNKSIEIRVYN